MRLLHARTGLFHWEEDPENVKYAILSHVWAREGEQSYQDLLKIQDEVRVQQAEGSSPSNDAVLTRLSSKIRHTCERARADGLELVWIDSCCIDKTSSAELSEAINSMFLWYSRSAICYAALPDVSGDDDPTERKSPFCKSVWFTRGWTLQELIAPEMVLFFSDEWQLIGGKHSLAGVIEEITGIDRDILTLKKPLNSVSVARRMFWASKRVTTRKEDEAYSLMGIFGVRMPTIYGEGREAFIRLQEEILRTIPDQSIFVWDQSPGQPEDFHIHTRQLRALLAVSPKAFSRSGRIEALSRAKFSTALRARDRGTIPPPIFSVTPYGIRSNLPYLVDGPFDSAVKIVPLACSEHKDHLIALILAVPEGEEEDVHTVGGVPISRRRDKDRSDDDQYRRWPEMAQVGIVPSTSTFSRLMYLPLRRRVAPRRYISNSYQYEVSEFFIAHRLALIPFLTRPASGEPLESIDLPKLEMEPPFRYGTFWFRPKEQYPMCIGGQRFIMSLNSRYASPVSRLDYNYALTTDHAFMVSGSEHTLVVTFYTQRYYKLQFEGINSLHASYSVVSTRTLREPKVDDTFNVALSINAAPNDAPRKTALPVAVSRDSGFDGIFEPLDDPVPGEHTAVDDWDRAGGSSKIARTRRFPLPSPPAAPGQAATVGRVETKVLQLTVTCHCPGSPRYPALFSLAADIFEVAPSSSNRSANPGALGDEDGNTAGRTVGGNVDTMEDWDETMGPQNADSDSDDDIAIVIDAGGDDHD